MSGQEPPVNVFDAEGNLAVMGSVYSVAFAETNSLFSSVHLPDALWNVSAVREDFDEMLGGMGLAALPLEGEKKLGLLDLLHVPILDGILTAVSPSLPGIDVWELRHRYPLHGSAAGIGLLLNHLRVVDGVSEICVLRGDYEGYAAQAGNQGFSVRQVELDEAWKVKGAVWFLSNPSAVTGEQLDQGLVDELVANNKVVFDVAYHGLHGPQPTVVPAGAWAVLWSLSKPWGLFWRRVGILASSVEIPAAYGTRWYKDPERLLATYGVVAKYGPSAMSEKYRWAQEQAIEALGATGIVAHPSSTLLLASIRRDEVSEEIWRQVSRAERIKGSGVARVCLSPLLERVIATKK